MASDPCIDHAEFSRTGFERAGLPDQAHAASSCEPTVLIIDRDVEFARAAAEFARSRGCRVAMAHSLEQSRRIAGRERSDLMLLDPVLPDGSGLDLLDELDLARHARIAVETDQPSVESAARVVSLPISDYLVKPLCPQRYAALIDDAVNRAHAQVPPRIAGMIGECEAISGVQEDLAGIATTTASVLVAGESGTGKELVARALHQQSGRKGPFVAVNCGAIAPDLLASHLFGHERGSFTGAATRHVGYFEQANRGTLFLDEVTEMPPALQVYLLRALETGTITRVGGSEAIAFDTRVVAATNRDPAAAIDEGRLREDLFYRLADFIVDLPPLRAREDDVVLLARHFVERLNRQHRTRKRLDPRTEDALCQYHWPGNVRELRSVVQRAFILGDADTVSIRNPGRRLARNRGADDEDTVTFSVGMSYAEVEQEMLLKTLARFDNDKTRAARALGVSVRTIHNQLSRHRAGARSGDRAAAGDAAKGGAAGASDLHAISA